MRGLLERWQAAHDTAPGVNPFGSERRYKRCYYDPRVERWRIVYGGNTSGYRVDPDTFEGRADIFAAVIEALEARGWEWGVSYERLDDGAFQYLAYIFRPGEKPGGLGEHETLAAALLTAYVDALETEAKP